MKHLTDALLKPFEAVINKAASIVEAIRLLGEISQDVKDLRKEINDVKEYLARQEEIARVMIEQGNFTDEDEFFVPIDEDIDKKDMN